VKKYQLSKKVSRRGWALLLLAIIGAMLVGILAFAISQILYVVILLPMVMGLLGGLLSLMVINWGKVRCQMIATIMGLLIGIAIFIAYLFPDYLIYRANYIGWENITDVQELAATSQEFDRHLQEKSGSTGFIGFLRSEANDGMLLIGSRSYGAKGSRLRAKGVGVWLNWLLELAVICGVTTLLARWRVFWPFSELSNRWFNRATRLGTLSQTDLEQAMTILDEGKLAEFIEMVQFKAPVVSGGWEVHFKRCDDDYSEVALTIGKAVIVGKRLKLRQQQAWLLDRQDLETVAAAMREKHAEI
jgi:hypothetical protein